MTNVDQFAKCFADEATSDSSVDDDQVWAYIAQSSLTIANIIIVIKSHSVIICIDIWYCNTSPSRR